MRNRNHRRGGHYPGHKRDPFLLAIEEFVGWEPGKPEPMVEYELHNEPCPIAISEACWLVWNCTDILPGDAATALKDCGVEFGKQTYAAAARAMLWEIKRELTA